jgi:proline iminopeptidase
MDLHDHAPQLSSVESRSTRMRAARSLPNGGRQVLAGVLLLGVAAVALVIGAAASLAVAAVVPHPWVFFLSALPLVGLTAYALGRPVLRLFGAPSRSRAASWLAVAAMVVVGTTGAATVMRPGPVLDPTPAPPGTRFWSLPTGSRIAYNHQPAVGRPRSGPVVFLHGGPGTPGEGLPAVAPHLAGDGFEVYAYDQLGAGRSSRLTDVTGYTVARQVADLEAIRVVIDAEQLVLVGQSWGATLAAAYLAAHPDRVAKVVFTSPGAIWEPAFAGGVEEPWSRLDPADQQQLDRLTQQPRIMAAFLLLGVSPRSAHALVPDAEADTFMHRLAVLGKDTASCADQPPRPAHGNLQGFYVNQLTVSNSLLVPDPRPALRRVPTPAVVLRGDCDFVRPEVADDYVRTFRAARLVRVPGAGHAIASAQPATYLSVLRNFLLE